MLKLKKRTYIPDNKSNKNKFMFTKEFFAGFQKKICKDSSNYYLEMIQIINSNSTTPLYKMEDYIICQLIIFYLSILNYQNHFENVIEYIQNIQHQRKNQLIIKKIQPISKQINLIKQKNQRPFTLKDSLNRQQQRINNQIKQLQTKRNQFLIEKNRIKLVDNFFLMLERIYYKTKIINNDDHQRNFIQIFMGFFQCRTIKSCPSLWMIQNQYVIVRSSSLIINEAIKQNMFCYYFDNNQETVLMKFNDAFSIISAFIQEKQSNIFERCNRNRQTDIKMSNQYMSLNNIQQMERKQNTRGYVAHKDVEQNKNQELNRKYYQLLKLQPNAQVNFELFMQDKIPKAIIQHKEDLLRFYFKNGHKNHQSFHLVFQQLKQMRQIKAIFKQFHYFNNELIEDTKKKINNLKDHLQKWQIIAKQRKLLA